LHSSSCGDIVILVRLGKKVELVLAFVGVERVEISRAVAAAKLVFSRGYEGKCVVGAATERRVVVVVEHEVAYGFFC
jgi:hypothetical protein